MSDKLSTLSVLGDRSLHDLLGSLGANNPELAGFVDQFPRQVGDLLWLLSHKRDRLAEAMKLPGFDSEGMLHLMETLLGGLETKRTLEEENMRARDWVDCLIQIDDREKRKEKMKCDMERIYVAGHEVFFIFISALGRIDFPLHRDNLLFPLELEFDIFREAVKVVQAQPDFEKWVSYVQDHCEENRESEEGAYLKAGLPKRSEKLTKFHGQVQDFLGQHYSDEKFSILLAGFKETLRRTFGPNYEGYYTYGTTNAFRALQDRFWKTYPQAKLYYTPYEYLKMPHLVVRDRREVIDMEDLDMSEDEIVAQVFRKSEMEQAQGKNDDPVVILVSSEFRAGKRKLDIHRLSVLIEAKNKELGKKRYHLWIDAAQDNRFFVHDDDPDYNPGNTNLYVGDAVFFSKRIGGTGKGLVLLNKNTYPSESDIAYGMSEGSGGGINEGHLIDIMGNLFLERTKIAHQLRDLVRISGLWRFTGKGKFLDSEVQKAQDLMKELPHLSRYFVFETQDVPQSDYEWQVHRILRLKRNRGSNMDVEGLVKRLGDQEFKVEGFSVWGLEKIAAIDFNQPFVSFVQQVREAQEYHGNHLLCELLPARIEDEDTVKDWVNQKIDEHEVIRIFLNVLHKPDTLTSLLRAADEIIGEMESED